ncbi:hypothetical protein BaRGS_00012365, partial [Batillaria attramentaria]
MKHRARTHTLQLHSQQQQEIKCISLTSDLQRSQKESERILKYLPIPLQIATKPCFQHVGLSSLVLSSTYWGFLSRASVL